MKEINLAKSSYQDAILSYETSGRMNEIHGSRRSFKLKVSARHLYGARVSDRRPPSHVTPYNRTMTLKIETRPFLHIIHS
jgi:hypothetical protein